MTGALFVLVLGLACIYGACYMLSVRAGGSKMSKTKNVSAATPGPWIVTAQQEREDFDDGTHMDRVEAYIGEPGRLAHCGKHVAKVMGWGMDFDRCPEMQANARLIAAAPDLLAALLEMVDKDDRQGRPCVIRARAAIAKAGGA